MDDMDLIFRGANLGAAALMVLGGLGQFIGGGFKSVIIGIYVVAFGVATGVLEFSIPAQVARYMSFLFSFIGRGLFYVFAGTLLMDKTFLSGLFSALLIIVGLAYCLLEFVPSIEPPQNMRDAGFDNEDDIV